MRRISNTFLMLLMWGYSLKHEYSILEFAVYILLVERMSPRVFTNHVVRLIRHRNVISNYIYNIYQNHQYYKIPKTSSIVHCRTCYWLIWLPISKVLVLSSSFKFFIPMLLMRGYSLKHVYYISKFCNIYDWYFCIVQLNAFSHFD